MDKKREGKPDAPPSDLPLREQILANRVAWLNAHDAAIEERDAAISDREEIVKLREQTLEARREADTARAERERLLVQIREVNERLVVASLEAQGLADEADAARSAADENAERFRTLVLASSAIVWRASADGRVEVEREAWRKFTGLDATPDAWIEAIHPDDQQRVRDAWNASVATGVPYACQYRLQRRHGGYAWMIARGVPILRSGSVREWIGMMTDVTDRVRVEEARERFIGILGHDLRNPLASIMTGLELLSRLPEPYATRVIRVARSAHRIEAMVRDLLDFARGRLGTGIPVSPRPCNMAVICQDVVDELKQVHGTRSIEFDGIGELGGEWDPDRIEQVVSNLLGNAIVHGVGPIVVTSRDDGERVVTAVHSHGPPIPEAVVPTLFEPFTRQVAETHGGAASHGHDGLGLGLYIASEIVHAHGGTITASSVADAGTIFTFVLPRTVPRRARTTSGTWSLVDARR